MSILLYLVALFFIFGIGLVLVTDEVYFGGLFLGICIGIALGAAVTDELTKRKMSTNYY